MFISPQVHWSRGQWPPSCKNDDGLVGAHSNSWCLLKLFMHSFFQVVQECVAADVRCSEMLMSQNFEHANLICRRLMCCRSVCSFAIALKLSSCAAIHWSASIAACQSVEIPADPGRQQRKTAVTMQKKVQSLQCGSFLSIKFLSQFPWELAKTLAPDCRKLSFFHLPEGVRMPPQDVTDKVYAEFSLIVAGNESGKWGGQENVSVARLSFKESMLVQSTNHNLKSWMHNWVCSLCMLKIDPCCTLLDSNN